MLSLSKLTRLATVSLATVTSEPVQRALEVVDDALDLVNTQQNLCASFAAVLSGSEVGLSAEDKGEVLAERVCPALEERPAMAQVRFFRTSSVFPLSSLVRREGMLMLVRVEKPQLYAKFAGRLFAGSTLTAEDLIDLYTLKENTGDKAGDFAVALDLLVRAKVRWRISLSFLPLLRKRV